MNIRRKISDWPSVLNVWTFHVLSIENKLYTHKMSMIEKTPTEDEYQPCEFHVTIKNQFYTHEIVIKQAIPTADEYELPELGLSRL